MSKRTIGMGGFTLAEVLITLGIIGVVAAMTMPTLINSTNGAQYKTAYKKALSVMSQAVAMNIALNDYDLAETAATGTNGTEAQMDAQAQSLYSIFRNRMNVVKVKNGATFNVTAGDPNQYLIVSAGDTEDYTGFAGNHVTTSGHTFPAIEDAKTWDKETTLLFMNDGITFIFDNTQHTCIDGTATNNLEDEWCYGFIDVNGQKGPNRIVKCDSGRDGTNSGSEGDDDYACTVTNPTDIYPIAFYNQSVIPASGAARAVLYSK